ncbi:MAG: MG284/MPN403 family protein [Mycoplasmoidaceae bacterium]
MTNNIIKEVRSVFYLYRRNKLMVENFDYINKSEERITIKELEEYNNYISFIDNILKELDKEDSWILKNIFIEKKEKEELNYSISTYYWKLRKASSNFMDFWIW